MERRTEWRGILRVLGLGIVIGALGLWSGCKRGTEFGTDQHVEVETRLQVILEAGEKFADDCGRWPTPKETLIVLIEPPEDPDIRYKWKGPYLDDVGQLKDQWGSLIVWDFVKRRGTNEVDFMGWSAGPDRTPYTRDDVHLLPHDEWIPPNNGRPRVPEDWEPEKWDPGEEDEDKPEGAGD